MVWTHTAALGVVCSGGNYVVTQEFLLMSRIKEPSLRCDWIPVVHTPNISQVCTSCDTPAILKLTLDPDKKSARCELKTFISL